MSEHLKEKEDEMMVVAGCKEISGGGEELEKMDELIGRDQAETLDVRGDCDEYSKHLGRGKGGGRREGNGIRRQETHCC